MNSFSSYEIIKSALKEDMPEGDITTDSLGIRPQQGTAFLNAKSNVVLSGSGLFEQTISYLEPQAKFKWFYEDGDSVANQSRICEIEGDLLQILKAERVALNFLGRFSGIATLTRQYVKAIEGTSSVLLDTRKTTPLYRVFEKLAVTHGGGHNHRFNLSDAILIKDNHIRLMGGIKAAVKRISTHNTSPIEVEASTLEQVQECVDLKVHRILLDNMNNEQIKECLQIIPSTIQTEVSGNIDLARIRSVAMLGVNFISVGAITHSAPVADLSLLFNWKN